MIFKILCIKHTWCWFVNERQPKSSFFCSLQCPWQGDPLARCSFQGEKTQLSPFPPLMAITTVRQHPTTPLKLLRASGGRVAAMSLLCRKVYSQTQLGEVFPLPCPSTAAGFRNTQGERTPPFSLAMWKMCTTTIQQIFSYTLSYVPSWQSTWTTEPKKNPNCIFSFHLVLTFHKGMLSTYCHEFCKSDHRLSVPAMGEALLYYLEGPPG